jgi:DNA-binding MarR family transcriptional regulator
MRALHTTDVASWCAVDLTMPQLKALLLAHSPAGASHGEIARGLGVGLSTVTGIVDRLAEQGLVSRGEDPNDRRATRVVPTDAARALVERLYSYQRAGFRRLLEQATTETLVALADGLAGLEHATRKLHAERAATTAGDSPR